MNMLIAVYLLILTYVLIGLYRVRRKDGPGEGIAMIAHNFPKTGLAMLLICIFLWPIEKIAMAILIIGFMKDEE